MKKKRFDEIKGGEYFKYYNSIYIQAAGGYAINTKNGYERFLFGDANVIPVTVTIKVKEK